jgi:hypothetical protein
VETTPNMLTELARPIMQLGFAGFALILLVIVVWQFRELIKLLKENSHVISRMTDTMNLTQEKLRESVDLQVEVKDKLLARPCIRKFEHPPDKG